MVSVKLGILSLSLSLSDQLVLSHTVQQRQYRNNLEVVPIVPRRSLPVHRYRTLAIITQSSTRRLFCLLVREEAIFTKARAVKVRPISFPPGEKRLYAIQLTMQLHTTSLHSQLYIYANFNILYTLRSISKFSHKHNRIIQ